MSRVGAAFRPALQAGALGIAVFALAWLAGGVIWDAADVPPVWPVNAMVVAVLLRTAPRRWPVLLAVAFAADLGGHIVQEDETLLVSVGLSVCDLLEVTAFLLLLRRLVGPRLDLSQLKGLLAFAGLAVGVAAVTALGAALVLHLVRQADVLETIGVWTMSDALGLMIVTPAILTISRETWARFTARSHLGVRLALILLPAAAVAAAFVGPDLQVRWIGPILLVLVAFKADEAGTAIAVLLTGIVAVTLSALGYGAWPLTSGAPLTNALLLQSYLLGSAATAFPVAAAIARRSALQADLAAREAALAQSESRMRLLLERSSDVIIRVDAEDRMQYVSPSCRRYGYEPEELVGRRGYEMIHPDDLPKLQALIANLFSGAPEDRAADRAQRLRAKDGSWVWMEGNPTIIRDAEGRPIEVVSFLRDVSLRKAAEAALIDSEARFRRVTEASHDLVLSFDLRGRVTYASPAARHFGYEPDELLGRDCFALLHPDDAGPVRALNMALAADEPIDGGIGEYRVLSGAGEWIWVEGNPGVVRDESGRAVGFVNYLRDVSVRRAMEDELRRKTAEAEAAAVAKSEFLANMSHEIRTPLTGILGFAGLLNEAEGMPERAKTFAARIATAGQTLLSVVNDILDFSKIEAGQIELDPQPFDPADFVAETLDLVGAQAQAKGLSLRLDLKGALPAAVAADGARLRQILLNLLTNAIKFTAQGGLTVAVRHYAGGGGSLRISVTDTGVGIAPDQVQQLFQRFSQGDGSISRRYGGTGLGLAICRRLAELMGGTIGVESAPGRGSTFWFTIAAPIAETPVGDVALEGFAADAPPARILVVDDVATNRELVKAILEVFGHTIAEAGGGAEAVEAALHAPYDLILMDLQMPGMDGLAATRAIRATSDCNALTPIVAISANVMAEHVRACREAGLDDHIAKPIDAGDLLAKVARWTAPQHEAERERRAP